MSATLKAPAVLRAVRAGLVECFPDGNDVAVFPCDPQKLFKYRGSVWVSEVKAKPQVETLADVPDDHREDVMLTVTASAYVESDEAHTKAYMDAEDRVIELLDTVRAWLGENRDLDDTCDGFTIPDYRWGGKATDKGWVIDGFLEIRAMVELAAA